MKKRNAFTMIELVFVIAVLGIFASFAIPKLAATRDDAHVSKAVSTIAAVRSGIISERQSRLFRGDNKFITHIDSVGAGAAAAGSMIFDHNGTPANNILTYGVVTETGSGGWMKSATDQYTFTLGSVSAVFTYNPADGTFTCNRAAAGAAGELCRDLVD